MHRGYFRLWRKVLDSWQWSRRDWAYAWISLLIKAAGVEGHNGLKAGQLKFSMYEAAEEWGMSLNQVRLFLRRCEREGNIKWERGVGARGATRFENHTQNHTRNHTRSHTRNHTRLGLITICNWQEYQDPAERESHPESHPSSQASHTHNHTFLNKEKEGKERKSTSPDGDSRTRPKKASKKTDPRIKQAIDFFFEKHKELRDSKYVVKKTIDPPAIKRLLGTLDLDDLKTRIVQFLNDPLSWMDRPEHSIILLEKRINKYGASRKASKPDDEPDYLPSRRPNENRRT